MTDCGENYFYVSMGIGVYETVGNNNWYMINNCHFGFKAYCEFLVSG